MAQFVHFALIVAVNPGCNGRLTFSLRETVQDFLRSLVIFLHLLSSMPHHVDWNLVSELNLLWIRISMGVYIFRSSLDMKRFLVESLLLRLGKFLL